MKTYTGTHGASTVSVQARTPFEAQSKACQALGLEGKLQHLVKVRVV